VREAKPRTSRSAAVDLDSNSGSILIAGAGNWLIVGDRVGPRVLELAAERYGPEVELVDIGSTALALFDVLDGQDLLLVVDACVGHGVPGEVKIVEPDLSASPDRGTSTHQIGPVESLLIARYLNPESLPRRVLMVLVETGSLTGPEENATCAEVIRILDHEIDHWRGQKIEPNAVRTGGGS
jgi:hydrogenase maturation protease